MSNLKTRPRPLIFGCEGYHLLPEEREFFTESDPFGFILFERNIFSPNQVRCLINDLRDLTGNVDLPILIDQEGGRVARLRPPYWRIFLAARQLVSRTGDDVEKTCRAIFINSRILAHELSELFITIDCMPVLDLAVAGAHEVIGDRAYGSAPARVAKYGRAACDGLLAGGILPVIKHIPGHGRATVDSHISLPSVQSKRNELERTDFVPFRALRHMPLGMTAHVVFSDIDPMRPATLSPVIVSDVIRGDIGFDGLLITDDICMSALQGSLLERAQASLSAGCDIILHCSSILSEMKELAGGIKTMADSSWRRAERAVEFSTKQFARMDLEVARKELVRLMA